MPGRFAVYLETPALSPPADWEGPILDVISGTVFREVNRAGTFTIAVPMSAAGAAAVKVGWRVTLRQERIGAVDSAGDPQPDVPLLYRGKVLRPTPVIDDAGATTLVLDGETFLGSLADAWVPSGSDFAHVTLNAILTSLLTPLGVTWEVPPRCSTDPFSISLNDMTVLAACIRLAEFTRTNLSDGFDGVIRFTDEDLLPDPAINVCKDDPILRITGLERSSARPEEAAWAGFGVVGWAPTISYDGSELVNKLKVVGVDFDNNELTLEAAEGGNYTIHTGTGPVRNYFYIEDTESRDKYGPVESQLVRTDIKNPNDDPVSRAQAKRVLAAIATGEMLRRRSEIFTFQADLLNGEDIYAKPGERAYVRYKGRAIQGAAPTDVDVDLFCLIARRADRIGPEGVRLVSLDLTTPELQYPVPTLPDATAIPTPKANQLPPVRDPGLFGTTGTGGGGTSGVLGFATGKSAGGGTGGGLAAATGGGGKSVGSSSPIGMGAGGGAISGRTLAAGGGGGGGVLAASGPGGGGTGSSSPIGIGVGGGATLGGRIAAAGAGGGLAAATGPGGGGAVGRSSAIGGSSSGMLGQAMQKSGLAWAGGGLAAATGPGGGGTGSSSPIGIGGGGGFGGRAPAAGTGGGLAAATGGGGGVVGRSSPIGSSGSSGLAMRSAGAGFIGIMGYSGPDAGSGGVFARMGPSTGGGGLAAASGPGGGVSGASSPIGPAPMGGGVLGSSGPGGGAAGGISGGGVSSGLSARAPAGGGLQGASGPNVEVDEDAGKIGPVGPTVGVNPGDGNQEPFPVDARGRATGDYVRRTVGPDPTGHQAGSDRTAPGAADRAGGGGPAGAWRSNMIRDDALAPYGVSDPFAAMPKNWGHATVPLDPAVTKMLYEMHHGIGSYQPCCADKHTDVGPPPGPPGPDDPGIPTPIRACYVPFTAGAVQDFRFVEKWGNGWADPGLGGDGSIHPDTDRAVIVLVSSSADPVLVVSGATPTLLRAYDSSSPANFGGDGHTWWRFYSIIPTADLIDFAGTTGVTRNVTFFRASAVLPGTGVGGVDMQFTSELTYTGSHFGEAIETASASTSAVYGDVVWMYINSVYRSIDDITFTKEFNAPEVPFNHDFALHNAEFVTFTPGGGAASATDWNLSDARNDGFAAHSYTCRFTGDAVASDFPGACRILVLAASLRLRALCESHLID